MPPDLVAVVAALLASSALTPAARSIALRLRAVSVPGGRNVHASSIPRLGGLAITLAWCLPLLGFLLLSATLRRELIDHERQLAAVIGGGLVLCAVGAWDDLRGVRATYKLLAQLAVASLAFMAGFRIDAVFLPFIGTLSMGIFGFAVTLIWIVGITNAVNLIDGLDGLAAGVAFFAAFTSLIVAHLSGSPFVALLMATLMGALVGFLFFNFNPARIFMGDSGSYFLGYVLATTSLAGAVQQKASTAVSLLVPVLALGVPIFDTLFSMVRRVLERRPIFSPDRGHIHHRLLEIGLTHRRAVILLYGVSVVLAAGSIAVSLGRSWPVGVALVCVSIVFVALVRFLGYFEYVQVLRRQSAPVYDHQTERLRHALPVLIRALDDAHTHQDVLAVMNDVLRESELSCLRIHSGGTDVGCWQRPDHGAGARDIVRVTFPIGSDARARAHVHFEWGNDGATPTLQTQILLQLLVDAIARAFDRTSKALAPLARAEDSTTEARANVPAPTSP